MKSLGRILLIADGPVELDRLKALFTHVATAWEIEYCTSEREAVGLLEQSEFEVIFADLVSGPLATAQFLHEIWKKHPKVVRYLLASSIDTDVMVTCVLGAHQFLQQPVTEEGLKAALQRVEFLGRLVKNQRIQSLVSRMRTLPSRPTLYLEVMRELRSSNANAKIVGELVAKDLAISTKLIQVVNSAYYGLAQQVTEPADAVLLLGMETTASLILSIEAFARFDKVKPLYFSIDRVWKHSQAVAQEAKKVAELMTNDSALAKDAFTAGLLHDIGKLALALNFEEQYQGALKLAEKKNLEAWEVETEVFGASHAEAGAYLLSLWGLPFSIIEAVASHHLPAREVGNKFSALTAVHLVERLEREKSLAEHAGNQANVDLDYPEELEIEPNIDSLRAIVRGDESGEAQFFIKRSARDMAPESKEDVPPPPPMPIMVPASEPVRYSIKEDKTPVSRLVFVGGGICLVLLLLVMGGLWVSKELLLNSPSPEIPKKVYAKNVRPAATPKKVEVAPKPEVTTPQPSPEASPNVEETFASLKLQGIIYRGVDSSVLINGHTLKLGDEIDGARVYSVEPLQVTLEKGGVQRKLKLN